MNKYNGNLDFGIKNIYFPFKTSGKFLMFQSA